MTLEKTEISIRDLAKNLICPGHLFIQTSNERKFYLMKPGTYIDVNFIKKHASLNTVFELNPVASKEVQDDFYKTLKEFVYLQFEKDLRFKSFEILQKFKFYFSTENHFLNFVIPCFQVFGSIPIEYLQKMNETDLYLFRKATYSAAFSVIISIANGIYHPLMIRDLFNLTLTLDLGICSEDYSYFVAKACNQENRNPGSGKEWLQVNKATKEELTTFLEHPERSYLIFQEEKIKLVHKELSQITLYQHELSSGKGFPRGITKGLVSTWESVVILSDSMVEILEEYDFENRVVSYVLDFQNEKLNNLPINKVYQRFCFSLNKIDNFNKTGT